jgi:hypothetical protein
MANVTSASVIPLDQPPRQKPLSPRVEATADEFFDLEEIVLRRLRAIRDLHGRDMTVEICARLCDSIASYVEVVQEDWRGREHLRHALRTYGVRDDD